MLLYVANLGRWACAIVLALSAFYHMYWLMKNSDNESNKTLDETGEFRAASVPLRDCVCHAGLATSYSMLAVMVAP